MLDTTMKQQLKAYLENLKTPVTLIANIGHGSKAGEMQQLVDDIVELSPLVSAEFVENTSERSPSMRVRSEKNTDIRFSGLPMGHEFTSLVLALLHSGGHPIKIEPELIEQVRNLKGTFSFKTFISLSCQTCPDVVQALNMMAAINPDITHEMVDGGLFPEDVDTYKIMSVPTVFLNDEQFSQGRISLEDILSKIDTAGDAKRAEAISEKDPFDFLIIGGGPAGAAAAVYGARKGIRTGIVADDFGGQLLDTMSIENFISVKETDGPHMVASLEEHVKQYDVDIINKQRANKIDELSDNDGLIKVTLESGAHVKSKAVLLATGARWRELNVPGEKEYKGKGVAYCPHCDGPLFKGKSVAVVGGGNSGVEAAIDLAGIVKDVTLIEFSDKLIADEVLQNKLRSLPNVTIVLNAMTTEVQGNGEKVTGLVYTNRETDDSHQVTLDGIFVQIGLVPNTEFLQDDIELSPRGEIIVGAHGETSMRGVFAAGDVTTVAFKQIIIAMGSGAHAALGAFDYLMRAPVIADKKVPEKAIA